MNETLTTILNTPLSIIADEAVIIMNNIHFVRADWFYVFIPLILYLFFYSKRSQNNKNWRSVVDPKLLPFVLTKSTGKPRRYPLLLIFIASSLCITALAGPVYKKLPQPVYREQSSLVVLLDLSKSMNATDIRPSRLARAKLKLLDILKTRKTGQTALIVYAADAFVVTPLTDDNATIANLVPSLETDMMPAQGSNLSKALAKAFSLFSQAGIIKGDILVVTDGIHSKHETTIKKVLSQGHRLSIFGIGTTEGGPIPLSNSSDGGFLLDSNGAIVIPKLRPAQLQQYALSGSGLYASLAADDSDTNKLTRLFETKDLAESKDGQDINSDIWQEEGHWLLLPLLLFAALWARKGWIAAMLPFVITFITALPQPAYAVNDVKTGSNTEHRYFDTQHLWSSPDQKAMQAFDAGDNKNAAEQFTQTEWKASAYYRNGDYEQAVNTLEQTNTSDGHYNKANALAQLGKYKEAIKSYDEALTLNSNNEDARYNRELVEQALKEQQKKSQKDNSEQDSSDEDKSDKEDSDQESNKQEDGDKKSEKDQQSESKDQDGENQKNENQQPSDENKSPEQQQAEDKELKQRDADKEKENEQAEQKQHEQDQEEEQEQQSDRVENKDTEENDAKEEPQEIEINPMEASITEEEKATEQWLKRIPDDPGGLLRRKFLYQYKQIPNQTDTDEPW